MQPHPDYAEMPFEDVLRRFDPMIQKVARAYHKVFPCHEREDYAQVAAIGLWKAHERLRRGRLKQSERFAGYARAMARGEIQRWLGRTNFLVRLPADVIRRRRPGVDVHEMNKQTQPLRLEGPAPVRTHEQPHRLVDLIPAPEVDLALQMDVQTGLVRLNENLRRVLVARMHGYSVGEVAELAGLKNKQAVYDRVWRARRILARHLGCTERGTGRG